MVEQLSIFEVNQDIISFDVKDNVRVIVPDLVRGKGGNGESHFYLQKFERKRGEVTEVVQKPSLQYHVDFDGEKAIIYHDELKYW